jgi:hypothetical protein
MPSFRQIAQGGFRKEGRLLAGEKWLIFHPKALTGIF